MAKPAKPVKVNIIKKLIIVDAEPSHVWKALTDPKMTKKYFFGFKVYSDWKPGSEIKFARRFLWMKIELKGKILQVEPEKLLQYTLVNSRSARNGSVPSESLVTDVLTYTNGKTHLNITDDIGEGNDGVNRYIKSVKAWDKILKGLKESVEAGARN